MRRRRHRPQRSRRCRARLSDLQSRIYPPGCFVRQFDAFCASAKPDLFKEPRKAGEIFLRNLRIVVTPFAPVRRRRAKGVTTKSEILPRFQRGGGDSRGRSVEPAHDRPLVWTCSLTSRSCNTKRREDRGPRTRMHEDTRFRPRYGGRASSRKIFRTNPIPFQPSQRPSVSEEWRCESGT
jgi:hypothetical protein